jgi:transposase
MQSGVPTKFWCMVAEEGMTGKIVVGVDVSKNWVDFSVYGKPEVDRVHNTLEAIGRWLDRVRPTLVAFEPTGGHERLLRKALSARNIMFIRVHPNDVIAFRKSRGIKAKTDRIDARLIAVFAAEELSRRGARIRFDADETLRELSARRRQLVATLQAERCRLASVQVGGVRNSLEVIIAALAQSLATIELEMRAHVAANPAMAKLAALLQTVKGIGPIVALTMVAELPELGYLTGKQIAALLGLAPQTRRSGKTRYREPTGHGRSGVRAVLFNAARAAISHPSPFKTFYDRLVEQNQRPGKVALTAVMRKILVAANAIARDGEPWRFSHTPPSNKQIGSKGAARRGAFTHRTHPDAPALA